MTGQDVCVTGLGMVTPAGDGWRAGWERVCEGRATAALGRGMPVAHLSCAVGDIDPARLGRALSRKPDRCTQLALLAAREAVNEAGLDPGRWDGTRVAVVMGSGSGGSGTLEAQHRTLLQKGVQDMSPYAVPSSLSNSVSAQLAIEFTARGPSHTVSSACASGTTAIGTALDLLALGHCDIALAGGAEAALTAFNIAAYDRIGALSHRFEDPAGALRPFDVERDGFVIGEGAGVLVLERTVDARARGARPFARIKGFGASSDAHHVVKPSPDGAGLTAAIRQALARAGAVPEDVSHVNAHGTGTPMGDRVEAAVLASLFPHRPPVTSTKGVTGHLLGAAGAVEAALTVLSVGQSLVPPTANLNELDPAVLLDIPTKCREQPLPLALSVSTGFGGQNAVLVVAPV
ncbi:beta-ketoacyl-[acyl-carrier-protein] synthase family protein [Streptomyces europaeiscabiei]|uniref:beta-ketoacyl-[acyl-carrier-protein] synthase family protein n=1 Tax=Streptomyces europaeiscabiei TaxID=146819 RepID=UPI0029B40CB9|nr:beta-ketoacyl-[acyl-carrier-protein] synthase family protein [Streptomyces europaeiscabiei]MDX3830845.1 beta-ketoacyl-[acyl-carrier-protein] synthase family protein [Streptomyces europaeiscabiei]